MLPSSIQKLKSVAIFCGSSTGKNEAYVNAVENIGTTFVNNDLTLIYGGAKVGLMGLLANNILSKQGKVVGVIPQSLVEIEVAHDKLTELYVVNSMHERKKLMSELADAFILMPGGIGSLDEFFEIFTWLKLGYIKKPCGILNINNYYNFILQFLRHCVDEGFLSQKDLESIYLEDNIDNLLSKFNS